MVRGVVVGRKKLRKHCVCEKKEGSKYGMSLEFSKEVGVREFREGDVRSLNISLMSSGVIDEIIEILGFGCDFVGDIKEVFKIGMRFWIGSSLSCKSVSFNKGFCCRRDLTWFLMGFLYLELKGRIDLKENASSGEYIILLPLSWMRKE